MAKTPKVRLYIRIRRSNGTDAFVDPAWNRNRTLREGYALIEGELEHHREGVYYLRFLRNGKRIWERIGQDADVAVVALRNNSPISRDLLIRDGLDQLTSQLRIGYFWTAQLTGVDPHDVRDLRSEDLHETSRNRRRAAREFLWHVFEMPLPAIEIPSRRRAVPHESQQSPRARRTFAGT